MGRFLDDPQPSYSGKFLDDAQPARAGKFLDEVNKETGGWKNPLTKIPFTRPSEAYAPTETNILGDLTRPAGGIHAAMKTVESRQIPAEYQDYPDVYGAMKLPDTLAAFGRGFSMPRSEEADYTIPLDVGTRPVGGAELIGRGAIGMLTAPENLIPFDAIPIAGNLLKAGTQALAKTKWAGPALHEFSKFGTRPRSGDLPGIFMSDKWAPAAENAFVDALHPAKPKRPTVKLPSGIVANPRSQDWGTAYQPNPSYEYAPMEQFQPGVTPVERGVGWGQSYVPEQKATVSPVQWGAESPALNGLESLQTPGDAMAALADPVLQGAEGGMPIKDFQAMSPNLPDDFYRVPDQQVQYQEWLRQNAVPPEAGSPEWQVPLHPAEEGRAAAQRAAQIVDRGPQGQGEFRFTSQEPMGGRMSPAPVVPKAGKPQHAFGYGKKGVQMEMPENFQYNQEGGQGEFDFMGRLSQGKPSDAFPLGKSKPRAQGKLGKPTVGTQPELDFPVSHQMPDGQGQFDFVNRLQGRKGAPVSAYDEAFPSEAPFPVPKAQGELDFRPSTKPLPEDVAAQVSKMKADGNVPSAKVPKEPVKKPVKTITTTYTPEELAAKEKFIADLAAKRKPSTPIAKPNLIETAAGTPEPVVNLDNVVQETPAAPVIDPAVKAKAHTLTAQEAKAIIKKGGKKVDVDAAELRLTWEEKKPRSIMTVEQAQRVVRKAAKGKKTNRDTLKKAQETLANTGDETPMPTPAPEPTPKPEPGVKRTPEQEKARLEKIIADKKKMGIKPQVPLTTKQSKKLQYEGSRITKGAHRDDTITIGEDTRPDDLALLAEDLKSEAQVLPAKAKAPSVDKKIDEIVGKAELNKYSDAEIAAERMRIQKIIWNLEEHIKEVKDPEIKQKLVNNLVEWNKNLDKPLQYLREQSKTNMTQKTNLRQRFGQRGQTTLYSGIPLPPGKPRKNFSAYEKATGADAKVDNKIGNFNLDRLPEAQQAQLRELFKGKEDQLNTDPMSWDETRALQDDLYAAPIVEAIKKGQYGQGAAELANDIDMHAAKLAAFRDVEFDNPETAKAVAKLLVDDTLDVKKVGTEVGRMLNIMKKKAQIGQTKLEMFQNLAQRLAKTPENKAELDAILQALKSKHPDEFADATKSEIFRFLLRNNMISGVLTITSNATSGVGMIAARPMMTALEIVAEKGRRALLGLPSKRSFKEVGAEMGAIVEGMRGKKLDPKLQAHNYTDRYTISPFAKKAMFAKSEAGKAFYETVNTVHGWPERTMKATDDKIKNIIGLMEEAAAKARGDDLSAQDVIRDIVEGQKRGTFQDEMTWVGKELARLRDSKTIKPWLRNVLYTLQPFIQTPDRIIAGGLKGSMLAPVNMVRRIAGGKYTGAFSKGAMASDMAGKALDRDMAQLMVAAPLVLGSFTLFVGDRLTGNAPTDPKARQAFYDSGKLDNAIRIGDRWIPIRLLPEPMATAMQINATAFQAFKDGEVNGDSFGRKVMDAAWKTTAMLATKPYLSGMNSLLTTMTQKEAPDDVLETTLAKKVGGLAVSSIIKDMSVVQRWIDKEARPMQDNVGDVIKARIPWASKDQAKEVNSFGDPIQHTMRGGDRSEPEYELLQEIPLPIPSRKLLGEDLSAKDFSELKTRLGRTRKKLYQRLARNEKFMNLPTGQKQFVMDKILPKLDAVTMKRVNTMAKIADPVYANKKLRLITGKKKATPRDLGVFPFSSK